MDLIQLMVMRCGVMWCLRVITIILIDRSRIDKIQKISNVETVDQETLSDTKPESTCRRWCENSYSCSCSGLHLQEVNKPVCGF